MTRTCRHCGAELTGPSGCAECGPFKPAPRGSYLPALAVPLALLLCLLLKGWFRAS